VTRAALAVSALAVRAAALAALAVRAAALAALCGCTGPGGRSDGSLPRPRILFLEAPDPILEGTVIRAVGISLDLVGETPWMRLSAKGRELVLDSLPHDAPGEHLFVVGADLIAAFGPGFVDVELVIEGAGVRSEPYLDTWELATDLPLRLDAAPGGDVHRNDVVVLRGAGFASASEGESFARFEGTFTREGGGSTPVDVRIPITLAERTARDRAIVVLTTDLGGVWPGTFEGTIRVESRLRSGASRTSDALPSALRFGRPELYSLEPRMASVGRILTIRGAGFLGGRDRPTEATIVRLSGTFTPRGGAPEPFGPVEIVPRFISGSAAQMVVETEVRGGRLVARLFGAARGEFRGTAVPIAIAGRDQVEGTPAPIEFVLGPVVQVVHLRFLPGFYSSLERFGLGRAAGTIEERIRQRIEDIYAGYNVDVRLEEPDDFDPTAYAVIEIGGPDPNGNGLFGYDNSPGKDVGNLRLFDRIGGANAETQADGYPGYGGVFVESLLWWSRHPDLPAARPPGSPDPDPLFDELFDPVRLRPATLAEIRGEGDPARVAVVARALDALASIIGETTAHELGHSFGMAQPYGPPTAFHNDLDGDGCLMDRGADRPLGERAQQPGYARTIFCYDEPSYLEQILGP
jgi:hypothetical protein